MYLLSIETTGAYASVALLQEESPGAPRVLGLIQGNDRFSHLQNLTPQIQQILKDASLSARDLTAVAVSHGPGSFTGIRIGVSTARALAQVLDIPCVAVSSLEALALRESRPQTRGVRRILCPVLDARRRQVYGAAYEMVDGVLVCRIPQASCLMTEFLQKLAGLEEDPAGRPTEFYFLGDGIDTCGDLVDAWAEEHGRQVSYAPAQIRYQDASSVALRGLQLWKEGKSCGYMDLQPEYLRMAEAEKKLMEKIQGKRS